MLHTSQAKPSSLYFAGVAAPLCALASDYNSSNNSCVDTFLELPAVFIFLVNFIYDVMPFAVIQFNVMQSDGMRYKATRCDAMS